MRLIIGLGKLGIQERGKWEPCCCGWWVVVGDDMMCGFGGIDVVELTLMIRNSRG